MDLNYNLYQLYSGFVESQMNMLSADLLFYIMKLPAFHSAKKKFCLHFRLVSRLQHVLSA